MWGRAPDALSWLKKTDAFVTSTAMVSLAGYVIGLGDRHPSNIMPQHATGHVVHIDFGDSFEVDMNRTKLPERVPFRLTRMIVNAFGVSGVEGKFRAAFNDIMWILRENKNSIISQLEIFVHEPIFMNGETADVGNEKNLHRIADKLDGNDPNEFGEQLPLTPEKQVDALIKIAIDHTRYIQHYLGWCSF